MTIPNIATLDHGTYGHVLSYLISPCFGPLGFAGESEAEAKLKMEDEVKIEEGPKRLSAWILGAIRDLEFPRSCRKSMIFDKWVK